MLGFPDPPTFSLEPFLNSFCSKAVIRAVGVADLLYWFIMTDRRLQPLWYGDALQIFAAAEHPVADAGHAIWKGNACQAFAVFERSAADALQAFALFKSTYINALHAVG